MATVEDQERQEAISWIKNVVFKDATVYGIVRSVARSGMSRTIDFYVMRDNQPMYLTGYMSTILKMKRSKEGALKVAGCGMNMIFACVYELNRALGDDYQLRHDQL
jgi:hypothetical protein